MLARHVSDLTGPSSGAFYKLYLQIWYVVICVLLDTSSRYKVVGRVLPTTYVMNKTRSLKNFVYPVGLHIYIFLCGFTSFAGVDFYFLQAQIQQLTPDEQL